MSNSSNIWKALHESRQERPPKKSHKCESKCASCGAPVEDGEELCPDCIDLPKEEGLGDALVCECGYELTGSEKFCPECGAPVPGPANEEDDEDLPTDDVPEDEDIFVDLDGEEDDDGSTPAYEEDDEDLPEDDVVVTDGDEDPEDDDLEDVSEGRTRGLRLAPYNKDMVNYMGRVLESQKAPLPVKKAFESRMYDRCATWLRTARGINIDVTEGFTANEARRIRAHLSKIGAPAAIKKAFENGQYARVAAFLGRKS